MKKHQFYDCNCWAMVGAGFGLGVVLALFTSLKIVLIMAGENDILSQTTVLNGTVHIMAQDRLSLSTACLLKAKP